MTSDGCHKVFEKKTITTDLKKNFLFLRIVINLRWTIFCFSIFHWWTSVTFSSKIKSSSSLPTKKQAYHIFKLSILPPCITNLEFCNMLPYYAMRCRSVIQNRIPICKSTTDRQKRDVCFKMNTLHLVTGGTCHETLL